MGGMGDVPSGFAALTSLDSERYVELGFSFAILEIMMRDATGESEFIGDYRNGFLDFGWDKFSEETKIKKRNIEMNNGRAAMMGILALMVHEKLGVSILP